MDDFIINVLNLDGAFNSNRYIFNFIKSDIKASGIIVFPVDIKNIDSNKYNNPHYTFGNFLKGNACIRGINYTSNSLSVALIDEFNLLVITKLICFRFKQYNCLLKDNINNKLYVIERDDSFDLCN